MSVLSALQKIAKITQVKTIFCRFLVRLAEPADHFNYITLFLLKYSRTVPICPIWQVEEVKFSYCIFNLNFSEN